MLDWLVEGVFHNTVEIVAACTVSLIQFLREPDRARPYGSTDVQACITALWLTHSAGLNRVSCIRIDLPHSGVTGRSADLLRESRLANQKKCDAKAVGMPHLHTSILREQ